MATVEPTVGAPASATPPPSRGSQLSMGLMAMIFFIGSEVMLFGSLFAAYFFVRFNIAEQWPPIDPATGKAFELPVTLTAVNTAILVSSSFTIHWAEHRLKHYNDRKALERGLLVTMMLGATFLIIQINEYVNIGFTVRDTAFASTFFTLTGFHGAHVFVGLTILTIMFIRVKRARDFTPRWSTPLQAGSLYWHFVDVVWVILFILVYLL